jgi:hypothetical protein
MEKHEGCKAEKALDHLLKEKAHYNLRVVYANAHNIGPHPSIQRLSPGYPNRSRRGGMPLVGLGPSPA